MIAQLSTPYGLWTCTWLLELSLHWCQLHTASVGALSIQKSCHQLKTAVKLHTVSVDGGQAFTARCTSAGKKNTPHDYCIIYTPTTILHFTAAAAERCSKQPQHKLIYPQPSLVATSWNFPPHWRWLSSS